MWLGTCGWRLSIVTLFPAFLLPLFHRKCDLCVHAFSVQLDRSPFYKITLSFHGSRPRHKYHSIAVSESHSCAGLQLVPFSSCGAVTFLFDEVLKPTFFKITYLNAFEAKRRSNLETIGTKRAVLLRDDQSNHFD